MKENIKENRFCSFCNKEISEYRRKNSIYCSDLCKGRNFERKHPNRKMYQQNEKKQNKRVEGVGN